MDERPEPLAIVIRRSLLRALAYTEGNQRQAARLLGISERIMHHTMQKYGIPTARGIRTRERDLTNARARGQRLRLLAAAYAARYEGSVNI